MHHQARLKLKPNKRSQTPAVSENLLPASHRVHSGILPYLREVLGERKSTIFDLGPPTSTKFVYLCGAGTRVYWDNTQHSVCNAFHGKAAAAAPPERRNWAIPAFEEHVDLVLAWCYFDYLSLKDIRSLVQKLNEFFVEGSRLYFLIQHSAEISELAPTFELELDDILCYTTDSYTRNAPRYPPKQLEQVMPGFEIEKLYLMSNGLQEHLFCKTH